MAKIKGLFKGIKFISQMFVYKEHEMEIGYPTDVKHLAHIGWDNSSANAPSWMNEFKTASDFSSTSLSNFGQSKESLSWASQDFDQSEELQQTPVTLEEPLCTDIPKASRKMKWKRSKGSSPSSSSKNSTRSSKLRASYATAIDGAEGFCEQIRVN